MIFTELKTDEFYSTFDLLKTSKLDSSDLNQPNIRLFCLKENDKLIGVGGLEVIGSGALLRSVAVDTACQKQGLGALLVSHIEKAAKELGLSALYLLTNTAADFFKAQNYQVIHRDNFAEPLKQTAQFSGLCPISTICMMKIL
jgi:amino-acid N-acetyltransferase